MEATAGRGSDNGVCTYMGLSASGPGGTAPLSVASAEDTDDKTISNHRHNSALLEIIVFIMTLC
jgi:hypothetical protein